MSNPSLDEERRNDSTGAFSEKNMSNVDLEAFSEKNMSNVDLEAPSNAIDDDDVSEASTIYDLSVMDLDPKYRPVSIRYEEAKPSMRNGIRFPGQDDEILESPVSPTRKSYLFTGNTTPQFRELPVFCCGFLPLKSFIIIVNVISILIGIASLTLGVYELRRGQPFSAFVSSTNILLTSGPRIAAICCIGFGVAMVGIGTLGIVTAKDATDGKIQGSKKIIYAFFQGLAVLIMLIFILMAGVCVSALKMWSKEQVLTQADWQSNMIARPDQYCKSEQQLHCSGFTIGQCGMTQTARQNCPGHFCTDFCNVLNGAQVSSMNSAAICSSCRQAGTLGYDFHSCKQFEISSAAKSGCGPTLRTQLQDSYVALLILSIFASSWMLVVMGLAAHRACCIPPASRHGFT
jgi:hypothetical protein